MLKCSCFVVYLRQKIIAMKYKAKREKLFVRMDEGTYMLLREISDRTGNAVSVVVRALIDRELQGLVSEDGRLHMHRLNK